MSLRKRSNGTNALGRELSLVWLLGLTVPQLSGAAALNTNVLVDGGDFKTWDDSGMTFEFTASVAPFSLSEDDVLRTHVTFAKPILVTDTGDGDWVVGPYSSREVVVVRYCFEDPVTRADLTASSSIAIRAHGSLILDVTRMSISTSGPCSELVWIFADDLTAASFVLNGLDIETTVDSIGYYRFGSSNLYSSVFVGLAAGDLRYAVPVPEPSSLALLGLGCSSLVLTRRLRRRRGAG